MPLNLSKEEVAKLTSDQREAYARVHLDAVRTRRELCDRASGRNQSWVWHAIFLVLGAAGVVILPGLFLNLITVFGVAITLLFVFHWHTNRRIDALVSLLNLDREAENRPSSPDIAAGETEKSAD